eukprot:14904544-Alexandrium_andersonii.AAC.1
MPPGGPTPSATAACSARPCTVSRQLGLRLLLAGMSPGIRRLKIGRTSHHLHGNVASSTRAE